MNEETLAELAALTEAINAEDVDKATSEAMWDVATRSWLGSAVKPLAKCLHDLEEVVQTYDAGVMLVALYIGELNILRASRGFKFLPEFSAALRRNAQDIVDSLPPTAPPP